MSNRVFGDIPDYPVGTTFATRADASQAGVHRPTMAGIWGTASEGASSIVLNGGYRDDVDEGDAIWYTGHGGQLNGRQVSDQRLDDSGNAALVRSQLDGLPIRVLRGSGGDRDHSPAVGYRYDGLYLVTRHFPKAGLDGHLVWQFELARLSDSSTAVTVSGSVAPPVGQPVPSSVTRLTSRVARVSSVAEWVKRQHNYTCQVCGVVIELPSGPRYAEAAHIVPVGRPDYGPDEVSNVLCLCPNDHVRFDQGLLWVAEDLTVRDVAGKHVGQLATKPPHQVHLDMLKRHRDRWSPSPSASAPLPQIQTIPGAGEGTDLKIG